MLQSAACGFGGLALHAMTAGSASASALTPRPGHFAPHAKRVIMLYMPGGPSQGDLFVEKPVITKAHGNRVSPPDNGTQFRVTDFLAMKPVAPIRPRGESGMMVSDLLPHFSTIVDDVCLFTAAQADSKAHKIATLQLHTGMIFGNFPSTGAWISYGLGTENENLPSFVTISTSPYLSDTRLMGSGFLPAVHQGTLVTVPKRETDTPIRNLRDTTIDADKQRRRLDLTQRLNQKMLGGFETDLQMEGMIESFETAFRMQAEAPGLVDISSETQETNELYGINDKVTEQYGRALLMARRMSESGVRFVQVNIGAWDHHGNIAAGLPTQCAASDKPVTGLVKDLKRRGLLEETLVFWSGEFGRTLWSQDLSGSTPFARHGREHQQESYACWMAGGGIKGGTTYGQTDDFGLYPVNESFHIHDQHATVLHLLGLDHTQLTYRFSGRDFRLTDVHGRVPLELIA